MELWLSDKKRTGVISVISNALLTFLKLIVGFISGSLSLLSEGIHSLGDCVASIIAVYSVFHSDKPADSDHQFGHGKFEDMAGFIEAILVIISAVFIIGMGVKNILTTGNSHTFDADIALYVILFSVLTNFFVGSYVMNKGKRLESNALIGDGFHILSDVYSSIGVFLGILAVKYTGIYIIDPILAIIIGSMVLRTGFSLFGQNAGNLLDSSLPEENLEAIQNILEEYKKEGLLGVKKIKTSKSGHIKNIVLIIYLNSETTLYETHLLCDKIENRIEKELNNTNIIIHAEPKV